MIGAWTRRIRGRAKGLLLAGLLAALAQPVGTSDASPPTGAELDRFDRELAAWDVDSATRALADLDDGPEKEVRAAILSLYQGDYAATEARLANLLASEGENMEKDLRELAEYYLAIARGSQKALGSNVNIESEDGRFAVRFADAKDELLAPYLFDAMSKAYDALGQDTGVYPQPPIRYEFYDEPEKLAMVTTLSITNIQTTGTVGITKYLKVMMITPRVMLYGYGWLDTAVHEYAHYVITMRTRDNAPVWLQEGLAKLLERRWRLPADAPLDLDAPTQSALHTAIETEALITFDQMHPSFAMLPSQEDARLAYAQVYTMLYLLREERGQAGLADLLDRVARGEDAKDALAAAWGGDFDTFEAHWKKKTYQRTARPGTGKVKDLRFKDPGADEADPSLLGDVFSHLGGGKTRQHARLGVLLTLRGHKQAAVIEYEKARAASSEGRNDPKLARRLGELYLELGDAPKAAPLLDVAGKDDPENPNVAAAEGRAKRLTGDPEGARAALDRALKENPFIPSLHCDLAELTDDPEVKTREQALCRE
jgi:tetratricopeptide (TPR) repeat protein